MVDPNDSTSDFLKGLKGSEVSAGLLHNNQPVLDVVYAPVTPDGVPDLIAWVEGMDNLLRNGSAIAVDLSAQVLSDSDLVIVSAAAANKPQINQELCSPADFYAIPSIAYRLTKVDEGDGICGVSLYPVSAHDVVAGHALLIGATGMLIDKNGKPIHYATEANMLKISQRCFGRASSACVELARRNWEKVFAKAAN